MAINKKDIDKFMSFATYYLHLILAGISFQVSYDLILYVVPFLTFSILLFSLKIMFFKTHKLRRVK